MEEILELIKNRKNHFLLRAGALEILKKASKASERDLAIIIDMSKSEVHRLLKVAKAPDNLRHAILAHGIDYHAVYRLIQANYPEPLYYQMLMGQVTNHLEVKQYLERMKCNKESVTKNT